MQHSHISFLLQSGYDILPTPSNLLRWKLQDTASWATCGKRFTMEHALTSCNSSQQNFTWWHNKILTVLVEVIQRQCLTDHPKEPNIQFVAEGGGEEEDSCRSTGGSLRATQQLCQLSQWAMVVDFSKVLRFLEHICQIRLRLDIMVWSDALQSVKPAVLTIPWEANIDRAPRGKP